MNDGDLNVKVKMEANSIKNTKSKDPESGDTKDGTKKEKVDFTNFLAHAHNPVVVFFTLIFKVSSIVM